MHNHELDESMMSLLLFLLIHACMSWSLTITCCLSVSWCWYLMVVVVDNNMLMLLHDVHDVMLCCMIVMCFDMESWWCMFWYGLGWLKLEKGVVKRWIFEKVWRTNRLDEVSVAKKWNFPGTNRLVHCINRLYKLFVFEEVRIFHRSIDRPWELIDWFLCIFPINRLV